MSLALPLVVMVVALMTAWVFGRVARGRPVPVQQTIAAFGVMVLMLSPLVYDATVYDGTCGGGAGDVREPCSLAVFLAQRFRDGFAFMLAPALLWVLVFLMALNSPAAPSRAK
ncbi:MAG: hypothetical protein NW216_06730 [Hyphomicrobium sp.]|nr:hypothetical protein [Hyphomicrobium sp.]